MKNNQSVKPKDVELGNLETIYTNEDFKKTDVKSFSLAAYNNLQGATNLFGDYSTKKTLSTGFFNVALVNIFSIKAHFRIINNKKFSIIVDTEFLTT